MEQKFQALEGGDVEDELSQMKRGMLSGSRSKAQLPEGRPYDKVLQPRDAIDEELEVLRRKARE
jgi:phage shock protein A